MKKRPFLALLSGSSEAETLESFTRDIEKAAQLALCFPEANELKEVPSLRFAALLEQPPGGTSSTA